MSVRRLINLLLMCSFLLVLGQVRLSALEKELVSSDLSQIKSSHSIPADQVRLLDRLEKGIAYYESLKDYKAIFHKTEKIKGAVTDTEKIYLKFEKPWKIYMGWLNTAKKGLQVVYERGKNGDKLVIHKPGFLFGLVPLVFLEKNSPWVREGSESYGIEDAGVGTFLYDFTKAVIRSVREKKLKVRSKGEKIEVTFENTEKNEHYFAYRVLVLFDKKNDLPLQMELFDWENELMGAYSYNEFQANVGNNTEFRDQIHRQLFKVYAHQE